MTVDDRIRRAFYKSLALMVFVSSLALALAEGSVFPTGLTPLPAGIALLTGQRKRFVLSTPVANVLGVAAICAAVIEVVFGGTESRILSVVHLITYIMWIVLFMTRSTRRLWWLIALSVLQMALASVLTNSPFVGLTLIVFSCLAVWTLSLFTLQRLQQRVQADDTWRTLRQRRKGPEVATRAGIQSDSGTSWVGPRFRLMILGTCVASLVTSGVVFAVFPRVFIGSPIDLQTGVLLSPGLVSRTGFRDEIELGEFGPLLLSDERVVTLSIFRQRNGRRVPLDRFLADMGMDELLLRGTAMGWYIDGRWSRGRDDGYRALESNERHFAEGGSIADCYRVEVVQYPPVGRFAFAPMPVTGAQLRSVEGRLLRRSQTGSLIFDLAPGKDWGTSPSDHFNHAPITFEIFCPPLRNHQQPRLLLPEQLRRWLFPGSASAIRRHRAERHARQYGISPNLHHRLPHLTAFARQLCVHNGARLPPGRCAGRIVALLRDSGRYTYSLHPPPGRTDHDPVEEFLLNHRTGHCQYFASACALMLQSLDIPARIVNGFRGAQVAASGETIEVQQKHAHAWVEYRDRHRWIRLDPTPGRRDDVVASIRRSSMLAGLENTVEDIWKSGMNNVSADRQRQIIQPVIDFFRNLSNNVQRQGLTATVQDYLKNEDSGVRRSWRTATGLAAVLAALVLMRRRLWQMILRLRTRMLILTSTRQRNVTAVVQFYDTFQRTCARNGFRFLPTRTALENARAAALFFRLDADPETAGIAGSIAQAFNSVRYGHQVLDDAQVAELRLRLDRLIGHISISGPRTRRSSAQDSPQYRRDT